MCHHFATYMLTLTSLLWIFFSVVQRSFAAAAEAQCPTGVAKKAASNGEAPGRIVVSLRVFF